MAERGRVLSTWETAIEREDLRFWGYRTFHGLHEQSHGEGDQWITEQHFASIEPQMSEDRRSVGLCVMVGMGEYYESDSRGDFSLWLSRAEAQQLGEALLKQAAGDVDCGDGAHMMASPGAFPSCEAKTEQAAKTAASEAAA